MLRKDWYSFSPGYSMKGFVTVLVALLVSTSVHTNEFAPQVLNGENNIFIITLDGFRWQEVFGGADTALLHGAAGSANNVLAAYNGASPTERRKKLLPFFWTVVAQQGQLYGNRTRESFVNVSNPYALSYPGYNELLTGAVDLTVFNNGKTPNRNRSFLEELNTSAVFRGKVAAFASWDAFSFILNKDKRSFELNSGFDQLATTTQQSADADDMKNLRYDDLTFAACKDYVLRKKPSVVFLSVGGTDEAAHAKNYGAYLQQATRADQLIADLWQTIQTMQEYRGKTTFILTTDHGRGASVDTWHKHGLLVRGSSQTWLALLGPSVPALGERRQSPQLYLKNVKQLVLKILAQPSAL